MPTFKNAHDYLDNYFPTITFINRHRFVEWSEETRESIITFHQFFYRNPLFSASLSNIGEEISFNKSVVPLSEDTFATTTELSKRHAHLCPTVTDRISSKPGMFTCTITKRDLEGNLCNSHIRFRIIDNSIYHFDSKGCLVQTYASYYDMIRKYQLDI